MRSIGMVNKSKIVPNVYKKAFESVALKGQSLAISCVEGEISYEDAFIELIDDLTSVEMAIETVKKEEKFYGQTISFYEQKSDRRK